MATAIAGTASKILEDAKWKVREAVTAPQS